MNYWNRLAIVTGALTLASQVFAANFIVKYKQGAALSFPASSGVTLLDHHDEGSLLKVRPQESTKVKELASLLSNPDVEYVVEDFAIKAFTAPLDLDTYSGNLKEQWAVTKVKAEEAWAKAGNKGSRKVIVAVIDTGVDYNHPGLKENMVPGYNFKDNNSDPMDKTGAQNPGHGTHCAGIIGATGLQAGGTIGLSPEVSIMPLRFLGEDGSGDLMAGIKAIDYAISKGVKVISASWGAAVSRAQAKPLIEAVKRADDAGVIFVAAASNDGKNNDSYEVYPANSGLPNMIVVAASGPADEKPTWSNYGKSSVSLAAPGLNIMSTLPKNSYGNLSGTSMATPLVSGLVALLKSQDESLTGMEVRSLIQSTGAKVGIETACNCRVDAAAAMTTLIDKAAFLTPAAASLKPNDSLDFKVRNSKGPYKFESTNAAVATINDSGVLTAIAKGDTTVKVSDSKGVSLESLPIHIVEEKPDGGDGGGGLPPMECPLGSPELCQLICQILPQMPWCK